MSTKPLLPAAYSSSYALKTGKPTFDLFDTERLFNVLSNRAGTVIGSDYIVEERLGAAVSKVLVHTGDPKRALIEITRDNHDGSFESVHMVGARRMQRFGKALAQHGLR